MIVSWCIWFFSASHGFCRNYCLLVLFVWMKQLVTCNGPLLKQRTLLIIWRQFKRFIESVQASPARQTDIPNLSVFTDLIYLRKKKGRRRRGRKSGLSIQFANGIKWIFCIIYIIYVSPRFGFDPTFLPNCCGIPGTTRWAAHAHNYIAHALCRHAAHCLPRTLLPRCAPHNTNLCIMRSQTDLRGGPDTFSYIIQPPSSTY